MIAPDNQYIAVLDACVLAPMPLCDTLLRLAEEPAFYIPKWSDDILRELRSTLHRMGYSQAQAERRVAAMEAAFEDANVKSYARLIHSMTNDPKDRHVFAAAIRCGAHAIVTFNVKHFRQEPPDSWDLDILTPDDFLVHQFHFNDDLVAEKLAAQAQARGTPMDSLLDRLQHFAPNFVKHLRSAL